MHLNLLLNGNNADNGEKIQVIGNIDNKPGKSINDGNFEKFKEIFNRSHYGKMYNNNNEHQLNDVSVNLDSNQDSCNDYFVQKVWKIAKSVYENPVTALNEYINVTIPNYYDKFIEKELESSESRLIMLKSGKNKMKSTFTKDDNNLKTSNIINENTSTYGQVTNNVCSPNISIINKSNDRILHCHHSKQFKTTQRKNHNNKSCHQNEIKCPNHKGIVEMIMKDVLPIDDNHRLIHLCQMDSNKSLKQSIWQEAAAELYDINKPSRDLNSHYVKKNSNKKSLEIVKSNSFSDKTCTKSLKNCNIERIIKPCTVKESVKYYNSRSSTKSFQTNHSKNNNDKKTANSFITAKTVFEKKSKNKLNNLNPNYNNLHHICHCLQNVSVPNAERVIKKKLNYSSLDTTISSASSINSLNYKKIWRKAAKELCKFSPEISYEKKDFRFATSEDTSTVNSVYCSDALKESQKMILSKENNNESKMNHNANSVKDNQNKYCNSFINDKNEIIRCDKYRKDRFLSSCDNVIKKESGIHKDSKLKINCINGKNTEKIIKSNNSNRSVSSTKNKSLDKDESNNHTSCVNNKVKDDRNVVMSEDASKTSTVKFCKMKDYKCKKSLSEQVLLPSNELRKRIGKQKIKPGSDFGKDSYYSVLPRKPKEKDYIKKNERKISSSKIQYNDRLSKRKTELTNVPNKTVRNEIGRSNNKHVFLMDNNHKKGNFYNNEDVFFDSNDTYYCSLNNESNLNRYKNRNQVNISNKNYINYDPEIKLPECLCNSNYLNYNSMKFNNYFNVTLTCNPALFNIGCRKSKIRGNKNNSTNTKKLFPKMESNESSLFIKSLNKRNFLKNKFNREILKRTSNSELSIKSDNSSSTSSNQKNKSDELYKIKDKNHKRPKKYKTNQENLKKDSQSKNRKGKVKNNKINDNINCARSLKSITASEDTKSSSSSTGQKTKRSSIFSTRSLQSSSKSNVLADTSSHSANPETAEKLKISKVSSVMDKNKFFISRKLRSSSQPKLAELVPYKEKSIDVLNFSEASNPINLQHPKGTVHGLDGSKNQNGKTSKKQYCKRASPHKNCFFCCCNQDCSFKESIKRMFCISLPSTTSSETRSCCFNNKHTTETKYDKNCTCVS